VTSDNTGVAPMLSNPRPYTTAHSLAKEKEKNALQSAARGWRQFRNIDLNAAMPPIESETEKHEVCERDSPRHAHRDHHQAKAHR